MSLPDSGTPFASWRHEIPILDRMVPMNNCSQAPQTMRTRAAAEAYLDSWNESGMDWDAWVAEVERAREAFARLIGASPNDVAISTSVSHATASLASALAPRGERGTVVTTTAEFPTVGQIWLAQERRGLPVRWVPERDGVIEIEEYRNVVDERTLLLSVCHGYYQTGFKQDLSELTKMAHEMGALIYVDAYQTLGTCTLDVSETDIDFLASGNLKFLMGVPGIAFLYVSPGVVDRLEPTVTGWFGRADPFAFSVDTLDWADGARRFDTGTPPVINAFIARAGMEMIEEVGLAGIETWTTFLSGRLIEGGAARGLELIGTPDPAKKAPTTAFRVSGDSHRIELRMREFGIVASARGPAVRLAPHFYTTVEEVDRALDVLAQVIREEAG